MLTNILKKYGVKLNICMDVIMCNRFIVSAALSTSLL